jgi:nicotinamide-nucleotide amidase
VSARAGIVVTGTEVLTGVITDRNGPWLGGQLSAMGVEVAQISVVGDHPEDIRKALGWLRDEGVDLIVTSGGLGPTEDDLTVAVVAEFQGLELELDDALGKRVGKILDGVSKRWKGIDPEALERSRIKQSTIPAGAAILEPVGTAPGVVVDPLSGDGPTVVVLPGPPRELQPMWEAAVESGVFSGAIAGRVQRERRIVRMYGLPESEVAATIIAARDSGISVDELEITTCLRSGEVEIDTRFEPELTGVYDAFAEVVRERHGKQVFSEDGSTTDEIVARLLLERNMTVAVAESFTGGLMAARLTDMPGSSDTFAGGVVAYTADAKVSMVGVDRAVIEEHGVVSVEVAEALARGAAERFGAQAGIGLTGEAGPESASGRPVGTVCIAVVVNGVVSSSENTLRGQRADVRERGPVNAMHALRRALQSSA